MRCQENCESCTTDGSTCAVNLDYGFTYDEYGTKIGSRSVFQYTTGQWSGGRNNNQTIPPTTVVIETHLQEVHGFEICSVYVNGQKCHSCDELMCSDGFQGFDVNCENVLLPPIPTIDSGDMPASEAGFVGSVGPCDGRTGDVGPLTVFALQDPTLVAGCPPIFHVLEKS